MYGAFVAEARRARGLTQVQLAAISGVEQANISAIENGHRIPGAATLHRLLHACGFELIAAAGECVLACPPPDPDPLFDSLLTRVPGDEPPIVGRDTPMSVRSRVLTAVLDAAEAVVRSR
jgi:transcriptional regulator with XRE-family HTH domain